MKNLLQKHFIFAPFRFCGKHFALILIFSSLIFIGCKSENPPVTDANIKPVETPTREVIDDLGRRVKIPEKIERAVSLAPNLTEIVFAVGAGDKLVGVTTFCDYPEVAKKIQKIGDTMTPNIESIIALKPQIVLVSTASQVENFTKALDQQGIAYFVTNPQNLDGIFKSIKSAGEIFGRKNEGIEVVNNLQSRINLIGHSFSYTNLKRVKVFLQISKEPLFTIGKDSFLTEIIARAGGISATADVPTAYPKLSKETALAMNPEAIILSESPDNQVPNDAFKNSPAVRNGKVFKISADLLSRPGPRIIDAMEQIARALHPEVFE